MIPDLPMHITHRGNRREDMFFDDEDLSVYLKWLGEYAGRYGMEVWANRLFSTPLDEKTSVGGCEVAKVGLLN